MSQSKSILLRAMSMAMWSAWAEAPADAVSLY
jgi:hypothetical protein